MIQMSRSTLATIRINRMADQEARQARFPYDRIAFLPSAAAMDSKDLNDYKYGRISFDTLRMHIAYNNFLDGLYPDGIPEVAMRKFLQWSGWDRRYE